MVGPGDTEASLKVDFHGASPLPAALALDGRTLFTEFRPTPRFAARPSSPPASSQARACRPPALRQAASGGGAPARRPRRRVARVARPLRLCARVQFSLKDGVKEGGVVSVRFPSLNSQLYDSPYEAQLFGVFDCNKRLITHGDYYESKVKLVPGEYEVRLQIRHDKPELLTKLRQLSMVLEISLPDPLALGFHWSRAAAMGVPPANSGRVIIEANTRIAAYHRAVAARVAIPGDTIKGSYTVAKNSAEGLGAASRPGGFPVRTAAGGGEGRGEGGQEGRRREGSGGGGDAGRGDAWPRITQLGTLPAIKKLEAKKEEPVVVEKGGKSAFDAGAALGETKARYTALLDALKAECAAASADEQTLTLMGGHLAHQEGLCGCTDVGALEKLVTIADEVVALVDQTALAAAFGVAVDKDDKSEAKARKAAEVKKKALVAALPPRRSHSRTSTPPPPTRTRSPSSTPRSPPCTSGRSRKTTPLTCRWHRAHGRHATALSVLTDSLAKEKTPPSKESISQQLEIVEAPGGATGPTPARRPSS